MNFPDPNVTTEYESPDGLKYVWNGFAWEIECGGSPQVNLDPYLKKYGHNVDDAPGLSSYHWSQGVYLQGAEEGGTGSYIVMKDDMNIVSPRNIVLSANNNMSFSTYNSAMTFGAHTDLLMSATTGNVNLSSKGNNWIESREQDVILKATVGKERVDRVIDDTSDPKQIVNKEYVDQAITNNVPPAATQMVYWGIMPKDAPQGALWTDQDTLKQYVHTGSGTWAQVAQCTGDGETITAEEPWIYITDLRTMRQYSSTAWGSVKNCQKIMLYEWHYNDAHPGDVTQEWEWDENNDGNWVPYKPENDPYAFTDHNFTNNSYWTYQDAPESNDGTLEMDPAHPHPCTKLRVRLHNTWDTGETEVSEWAECFLAKSCVEANGETLQPPSTC